MFHHKRLSEELVLRVLQKLSECNDQSPRIRFINLQSLNEDPGHLLRDDLIHIKEQIDNYPREEVGVAIDVSQLID